MLLDRIPEKFDNDIDLKTDWRMNASCYGEYDQIYGIRKNAV